jgi:hypothetical protein
VPCAATDQNVAVPRTRTPQRRAVTFVVCMAGATLACSPTSNTSSPATPDVRAPSLGSTAASRGQPDAGSRCELATESVISRISAGVNGLSRPLSSVFVVRSAEFDDTWLVAAKLAGEGNVAVWAMSGDGSTYSVNPSAIAFSSWDAPSGTSALRYGSSNEARQAAACSAS